MMMMGGGSVGLSGGGLEGVYVCVVGGCRFNVGLGWLVIAESMWV